MAEVPAPLPVKRGRHPTRQLAGRAEAQPDPGPQVRGNQLRRNGGPRGAVLIVNACRTAASFPGLGDTSLTNTMLVAIPQGGAGVAAAVAIRQNSQGSPKPCLSPPSGSPRQLAATDPSGNTKDTAVASGSYAKAGRWAKVARINDSTQSARTCTERRYRWRGLMSGRSLSSPFCTQNVKPRNASDRAELSRRRD